MGGGGRRRGEEGESMEGKDEGKKGAKFSTV